MNKELLRYMLKPAGLLGGFALVGVVVLGIVNGQTTELIKANERKALMDQLTEVVDSGSYDNDLLNDMIAYPAASFHSSEPVIVYRARKAGVPVAAIIVTTNPRGYAGSIQMVVGVRSDLTLSGVRVVKHHETPGLGDKMETGKSDWVLGFNNKSLQNPSLADWKVKKDGGSFDQFTGATITPRAIIQAVRDVLIWTSEGDHFQTLFTLPSETMSSDTNVSQNQEEVIGNLK